MQLWNWLHLWCCHRAHKSYCPCTSSQGRKQFDSTTVDIYNRTIRTSNNNCKEIKGGVSNNGHYDPQEFNQLEKTPDYKPAASKSPLATKANLRVASRVGELENRNSFLLFHTDQYMLARKPKDLPSTPSPIIALVRESNQEGAETMFY